MMRLSHDFLLVSCLAMLPAAYSLSLRNVDTPITRPSHGSFAVVTDLEDGKACVYDEARPEEAFLPPDCACNFHRLAEIQTMCADEQIAKQEKEICDKPPCQICCSLSFDENAVSSTLKCEKKCPDSETVHDATTEFAGLLFQKVRAYAQIMSQAEPTPAAKHGEESYAEAQALSPLPQGDIKEPSTTAHGEKSPSEVKGSSPSPTGTQEIENIPVKSVEEELEQEEEKEAQTGARNSVQQEPKPEQASAVNQEQIASEKLTKEHSINDLPSPFEEDM